jgi:hypothetical protein
MIFSVAWCVWYLTGFAVFTIFTWNKRLPTLVDFSVAVFWPITGAVMAAAYGLIVTLEYLAIEANNNVQEDDKLEE